MPMQMQNPVMQPESPAALMERIMAIPTEEEMVAALECLTEEEYLSLPECPICKKFYPNKEPNDETLAAMKELDERKGKVYSANSWEEFMAELNSDDDDDDD